MIRGYFYGDGTRRRPFVDAVFQFPGHGITLDARLLVDTGADRTILGPYPALRLEIDFGLDFNTLPEGTPSTGVGGLATTRTIETILSLGAFSIPLSLTVLEPGLSPIPSLLGRDIVSQFALFIDQRTDRVFLLEPGEADALQLTW